MRIKHVDYNFEDRFIRMNIHERLTVPLDYLTNRAEMLSLKARDHYQKASNKERKEIQGQSKYYESGKNNNDMAGAARAAEVYDRTIEMLHKAVIKDGEEEVRVNKELFTLLQVC